MTIEDIEANLPNGFHDATLKTISIDYAERTAELGISVDISNPDAPENSLTENYRDGRLILSGLLFCIIEPPDLQSADLNANGLWIVSSGTVKSEGILKDLPSLLPKGSFVHYFFINNWNSYIFLAAMDARFE